MRVDSPMAATDVAKAAAELIAPIREDSMEIVVGSEHSPTGIRRLIVSRPHVVALSQQFSDVVDRRTSYNLLGKRSIKQVMMMDDDADMMRLVMLVAHLDCARLPNKLDLEELVRLAQLAERYNICRILTPYLEGWLTPHRKRTMELGYEQWLCVAWCFSLEADYILLADFFVLNCKTDTEGSLLHPASNLPLVFTEQFPHSNVDDIKRRRIRAIVRMLRVIYAILDEMRNRNHCQLQDASERSQMQCTALKKLRLERYLTRHDVLPQIQDASSMQTSPADLMRTLLNSNAVEVSGTPPMPDGESSDYAAFKQYDQLHDYCKVGSVLKEKLERELEKVMDEKVIHERTKSMYGIP